MDNLLDFSKIQDEKGKINAEPINKAFIDMDERISKQANVIADSLNHLPPSRSTVVEIPLTQPDTTAEVALLPEGDIFADLKQQIADEEEQLRNQQGEITDIQALLAARSQATVARLDALETALSSNHSFTNRAYELATRVQTEHAKTQLDLTHLSARITELERQVLQIEEINRRLADFETRILALERG